MGWIRKTGAFFRNEALNIFGYEHAKRGAVMLRRQWNSTTKPLCPACDKGRLYPFTETIEGCLVKFRGCNVCSHFQAVDVAKDKDSLQRLRDIAKSKAGLMTPDEYQALVRQYQISSRWLFGFSLSIALFAVYLLWTGYDAWTLLNVSMVALFMFVRGLVTSYRSWQAKERCWFVPGSFKRWLGQGKWLI